MSRGERPADAGITLIELLISAVVTAVLITVMCTMFVQVTKATSDGQSTRRATGIASTALEEITRVVRQGTVVATSASTSEGAVIGGVGSLCTGATGSTPTCLIIDSYADVTVTPGQSSVAPVRVVFSVDASGYLVEKRYAPTLTNGYYGFSGTTTTLNRTVNGPILTSATGTDALFVYWNSGGVQVVPSSTGLTAAQASTVTAVTVNVSAANTTSRGSDPVLVSNKVVMPNVAIVNGGS